MNANSISLHRVKNLIRYEWALEKWFYLFGSLGIFMISFGVFLNIWFNNIYGYVWKSEDYGFYVLVGFLIFSVFGISQTFIDLRTKNTSTRYLTLPASTMEKYIVQVCLRLVLPLMLYPILFWLSANLSVDVYYFIQRSLLEKTAIAEIHKMEVLYLYLLPFTSKDVGLWLLVGIVLSVPMLSFMGGIIFGKWGLIVMPSAVSIFLLIMFGSFFGLSWLVDASAFGAGGTYSIRIGKPEVFEGVPLFILVCLILVWTAVFLPFIVTYLKLKEREV